MQSKGGRSPAVAPAPSAMLRPRDGRSSLGTRRSPSVPWRGVRSPAEERPDAWSPREASQLCPPAGAGGRASAPSPGQDWSSAARRGQLSERPWLSAQAEELSGTAVQTVPSCKPALPDTQVLCVTAARVQAQGGKHGAASPSNGNTWKTTQRPYLGTKLLFPEGLVLLNRG